MALLPTNAGFNVDLEEVKSTDKVFYESENNKLTQLLSNDQYLIKCLDKIQAKKTVDVILNHNLGYNPMVQVMEVTNGAGYSGAGESPAGGDNISAYFRHTYVDRNAILIYLQKGLINPILQKEDEKTYIITDDGETSYQLFLS